jgi:RimK family alpha-L-glutamate ligase
MDFIYFSREPFSWGEKTVVNELKKLGYEAEVFDWSKVTIASKSFFYDGEHFNLPKASMLSSRVRTRYTQGEKLFLFDWLELLELCGVNFVNTPNSIRKASNKVYAATLLTQANLNVAETKLVTNIREIEEALHEWKDIIIKPIDGNGSSGMERLFYDNHRYGDELTKVLSVHQEFDVWTLLKTYKVLCLQKYVENPGRDIRVNVVKNKVVSICAKYAHANSWRTKDINKGMILEKFELTPEIEELAVNAVNVLGLDYAPIDILEGPNGPTIIEVNTALAIWPEHETMGITTDPEGSLKYYIKLIEEKISSSLVRS